MNKEQAAKKLGISVRTLQRYMSAKKISFTVRKTKTGEETIFDKADVERFKQEQKEERLTATVSPVVMPSPAVSEPVNPSTESTALALRFDTDSAPLVFMQRIAEALEAQTRTIEDVKGLTVAEAVEQSGEPISRIREALRSGALPSHGYGRARRIKTRDLVRFLVGL
jgi:hypothetical protein